MLGSGVHPPLGITAPRGVRGEAFALPAPGALRGDLSRFMGMLGGRNHPTPPLRAGSMKPSPQRSAMCDVSEVPEFTSARGHRSIWARSAQAHGAEM